MTLPETICLIRIVLILFLINVKTPVPQTQANQTDELASAATPAMDKPIRSRDLLNDRNCVYIEHEGMIYALKTTRAGKLILTK